jgi:hypothetical protein
VVVGACLAVAAASLAVQNAADFDPWGWIVWGREVLHLSLNTTQGPSWKPGAVVFTTIFALFGGIAPSLWLVAVRLGALLAVVAAYRIAGRIGGRFAGLVAAALVLVMHGFLPGALLGQAEPLMVGCLLFAVDRALLGYERASLMLFLLASSLRPEVWPLLAAYSLYLWLKSPMPKRWIVAAWGLLVLLWFGGDWWGSGNPFLSSTRAKEFVLSHANQHFSSPGLSTLKLASGYLHRPAILVFIVAVAVAVTRRARVVLVLAMATLAMLVTVAVMAQDGYPVLDRFLFGTLALAYVVIGIGVGYVVRIGSGGRPARAVLAAAVVIALLAPLAITNAGKWAAEVRTTQQWSDGVNTLPRLIAAAGGRERVVGCRGSLTTYFLMSPALAWDLNLPMTHIVTFHHSVSGLLFIRERDHVRGFETQKPVRSQTIARIPGWRVVRVVGRQGPASGC